jgi:hypothetical protein
MHRHRDGPGKGCDRVDAVELIGLVAGAMTTSAFVPQAVQT